MSERKHTPGPWEARKAPHGPIDIFAGDRDITILYGSAREADAALIAAAPDMLEALRKAVKQLESLGFDGSSSGADAAISKATGEPVEMRKAG